MSTPVTITTIGRVTNDLQLQISQNGNTEFIQFGLAVQRGYKTNVHPNFYQCIIFGEDAKRMMAAKVKKGSLLQIIGDQELEEYKKHNGSGWKAKITLLSWAYVPSNKQQKEDNSEEEFVAIEDCGENELPFN